MRRYLVVLALVTTTVLPATGCAPERVPAELVYIGDDEALVLANVDLGRMTVSSTTTVHESGVSFASWSLDGQRLAFVSGEGSDSRLHVGVMKDSALESTYICPVRQGSMGHGDVFWAPTGDWLVVSVGTDWIRGLDLYRLGECELEAELGGGRLPVVARWEVHHVCVAKRR